MKFGIAHVNPGKKLKRLMIILSLSKKLWSFLVLSINDKIIKISDTYDLYTSQGTPVSH